MRILSTGFIVSVPVGCLVVRIVIKRRILFPIYPVQQKYERYYIQKIMMI